MRHTFQRYRSIPAAASTLIPFMLLIPAQAFAQPEPPVQAELREIEVHAQKLMPPLRVREPSGTPMEEVTVRGQKSLAAYRLELDAAQDRIYEVFNASNSSDDFDIHCREELRTGTHIPQRVCRPNFLKTATADSAVEFLRGGNPQVAESRAYYMQRQLETEMRRLAVENAELFQAMRHYVLLEQNYNEARRERFGNRPDF